MNKPQNKQLFSIPLDSAVQKILKLCYFLTLSLFFISCGDKKTETSNLSNENTTDMASETKGTKTKTILCFGDSITAGYGLDTTDDAYPALLQEKIDSLGLSYAVVNSGVSGETSAGGKGRIDWILNQDIAVFLLELGANDGLRGVSPSETKNNLQDIIDAVNKKDGDTKIILAGMELPPNMGQNYTSEFRTIFADLAAENEVEFIPFILKDVGGIAELNQSDGIHPTPRGHEIIANTVWDYLLPLLKS